MNRKSKVRAVFETSMDTIWNSVSFPYKWKFISSFGFGAVIESLGPSPAPLVCERAMYNDAGGIVWRAGSDALGTPMP